MGDDTRSRPTSATSLNSLVLGSPSALPTAASQLKLCCLSIISLCRDLSACHQIEHRLGRYLYKGLDNVARHGSHKLSLRTASKQLPMSSSAMTVNPTTPKPAAAVVHNNDKVHEESQNVNPPQLDGRATASDTTTSDDDPGLNDNSNVPKLSYLKLFWFFFYNFGLFAWGGPVAQIALIKERLVVHDKWITLPRFQRVFSVYQILPGPEAAELCMFFGCLSAGRIGGIIAGIAFILPGFVLMLLASYLYSLAGFENKYFNASFRALQPIVAAMVRILISVQTPGRRGTSILTLSSRSCEQLTR